MNPEDRRLLLKSIELGEENNAILRRLQRSNRLGVAFKTFYWLIIIGVSLGAYIFIQPYFNAIKNVYNDFKVNLQTVNGIRDAFNSRTINITPNPQPEMKNK